jgi:hypothetical protein
MLAMVEIAETLLAFPGRGKAKKWITKLGVVYIYNLSY